MKSETNIIIQRSSENIMTSNSLEDEFKKFYTNLNLNNINHSTSNKNLRYALDQRSLEIIKESSSNENSKYTNTNNSKDKCYENLEYKNKRVIKDNNPNDYDEKINFNENEKNYYEGSKDKFEPRDIEININESLDDNNLQFYNGYGESNDESVKNIHISNINKSYNSNSFKNSANHQLINNRKNNLNLSNKESLCFTDISK